MENPTPGQGNTTGVTCDLVWAGEPHPRAKAMAPGQSNGNENT